MAVFHWKINLSLLLADGTFKHLSITLARVRSKAKLKFPELKDEELTSEVLQKYLKTRKPNPKKRIDLETLYDSYKEILRNSDIDLSPSMDCLFSFVMK